MVAANALLEYARKGFLEGSVDWDTDNIKAVLVDLAANTATKVITAASNATPIVVTSNSHGFSNGDVVLITGVLGNTNANGRFIIANVAANTFELTDYTTGANVAGNAAYTSGGYVTKISGDLNLSDITAGARIATSGNLASKTVIDGNIGGVADAADITFTAVTGALSHAIYIYKDTGTASTSRLIVAIVSATGLPVTPNGGDINASWANTAGVRIFRL